MRRAVVAACCLIAATPLHAQNRPAPTIGTEPDDQAQDQAPPVQPLQTRPAQPGRVAESAVGEVGQRQTREQTRSIPPMARISSRIQNRVQLRIRNRIDRTYDPQADAASPFAVAEDQARTTSRPKR